MLTVSDIMTTDVVTIRSSAKVAQAIALMQSQNVRALIVEKVAQGGAYSMLTERDIVYRLTAQDKDPTHVMVCEIMNTPCVVVEPTLSLTALAKAFLNAEIQRAPVVEEGQLVGVVSIRDIIMNSNVEPIELPNDWADKVEAALRHKRLAWGEEGQATEESAAAREVMKELRA